MSDNAIGLNNNETTENTSEEREAMLQQREQELKELEKRLAAKESMLADKESELADKATSLERADAVLKEKSAKLSDRDAVLADRELNFESELERRRSEQEKTLADIRLSSMNDIDAARKQKLEQLEADCESKQRETMDFCESRQRETAEFCEKLKVLTQQECERMRHETEVSLSEWRGQQSKEFTTVLEQERRQLAEAIVGDRAELTASQEELNRQRSEFAKEKLQHEENVRNVQFEKLQLDSDRKELTKQIDKQDAIVEKKVAARESAARADIAALEEQCRLLREQIESMKSRCESADTLEKTLGLSADRIHKQLVENTHRIKELEDQLVAAPSPDLIEKHERLLKDYEIVCAQKKELEIQNGDLIATATESSKLEAEVKQQMQEKANLENLVEIHKREITRLNEDIRRLQASSVQTAERNDRLRSLFDLRATRVKFAKDSAQPGNEIEWLEGIRQHCAEIEMVFPKRIIYAFHTALKCADWATITVLAGVSGTGKSELPRLYSEFGGINFFSAPVQPNWDSQEAMLGYFNSIDNRFDAQPLLRYLVRSTEDFRDADLATLKTELEASGYTSTSDCMSIALLDEMNLAHVEHYFADFLSKMEQRRGKAKKFVPTIEVKLGAGIRPYELRMSRNVLWIGTMNQDETTKSLSDKVLDRGIVINFPRPRVLKERSKLSDIDIYVKGLNIPALKKTTWDSWQVIKLEGMSEAQIGELMRFKKIVEKINEHLAYVGRALGHRVWQAIEFYIANYPEVIAEIENADGQLTPDLKKAMNTAFEDQIVQKIMPKLRGIETRGKSRELCLDRIKNLLDENGFKNLLEDFDNACRLGYGQFMWCTANYIDADEADEGALSAEPADDAE